MQNPIKILLELLVLLGLVLLCIFFIGPYAFKISNQIVVYKENVFRESNIIVDQKLPLRIFSLVPSVRDGRMVWFIDTRSRYNNTIKIGRGNCSNMVFGFATQLLSYDYPYEVIHILDPDGYLSGSGHTVINLPYSHGDHQGWGIFDVFEGGIPLNKEGKEVSRDDIKNLNFDESNGYIINPNTKQIMKSRYWSKSYLFSKGVYSFLTAAEINRYFRISDRFFYDFDLFGEREERYLYDGIALLFGYLPNVYLDQPDFDRLLSSNVNKFYYFISNILLLMMRFILSIIFCLIFYLSFIYIKQVKIFQR